MRWLTAILLLASQPALAETRAPSEAERASFYRHFQKQFPDAQGVQPQFAISRAAAADAWTVAASVDSVPVRGLKTLCRMTRSQFAFNGEWSMPAAPRQHVWLEKGACRVPPLPVALGQRMADSELVLMLEQQAKLLQSARLLFAGHTQCASQRSYNFRLAGIEVGTAGSSPEEMVGLVFQSDRNSQARVWVRRTGLEYDAWNVSCP